jgi:hypothetical protein
MNSGTTAAAVGWFGRVRIFSYSVGQAGAAANSSRVVAQYMHLVGRWRPALCAVALAQALWGYT